MFSIPNLQNSIPLHQDSIQYHQKIDKQVYIADFNMFTQFSASTLLDGVEVLAHIFNLQRMKIEGSLKNKFHHYDS